MDILFILHVRDAGHNICISIGNVNRVYPAQSFIPHIRNFTRVKIDFYPGKNPVFPEKIYQTGRMFIGGNLRIFLPPCQAFFLSQ